MLAPDTHHGALDALSDYLRSPAQATRLEALADTALTSRFCSWRGRSGNRYVFSVYPPAECPAFCNAVLLAVAHEPWGRRSVIGAFDTGAFPEPVLMAAQRTRGAHAGALEFHLHLLAPTAGERDAVCADLAPLRW